MDHAQEWVVALGSSPWVYLALFVFCAIDGFFPPVPSESLVVALGATWAATGVPNGWLVLLVAAAGAFTGDQIAFTIGRHVDVRALRLFRAEPAQRMLDWAQHALDTRGASFIIAARFVPVGRVAVNMSGGALGLRRRRFLLVVAVASTFWAAYGVALGALAGAWLRDRPLLAIAVGVGAGLLIGLALDPIIRRIIGASSSPGAGAPSAPRQTDPTRSP